MKRQFINLIFIFFITANGISQIIDSVLYVPYSNVDSIEYWHKIEVVEGKDYISHGYTQYCFCENHSSLKVPNHRSNNQICISEGYAENGIKNGKWTYWNNVKGICCNEYHLYPDSTITYKKGVKIEKEDNLGHYFYSGNQTRIELFMKNEFPNFVLECGEDSCEIIINNKYLLKTIDKEYLEIEMDMIVAGEYNFETRKIINECKEH
jgi:hypothetical protein